MIKVALQIDGWEKEIIVTEHIFDSCVISYSFNPIPNIVDSSFSDEKIPGKLFQNNFKFYRTNERSKRGYPIFKAEL